MFNFPPVINLLMKTPKRCMIIFADRRAIQWHDCLSLLCALIDGKESPTEVPMYQEDVNCALLQSRSSIPCSAVMYCQYMTDCPFVLNLQVYSCAVQTSVKSRSASYRCYSKNFVIVSSLCCVCINRQSKIHSLLLQFICVSMQREERHWSNKSCSYLNFDPVTLPSAASDHILAG